MRALLFSLYWRRQTLVLGFCSSRSLAFNVSPCEACLSSSLRLSVSYVQPLGCGTRFLMDCRFKLYGGARGESAREIICSNDSRRRRCFSKAGLWEKIRLWDHGSGSSLLRGWRSGCDRDRVGLIVAVGDGGGRNDIRSQGLKDSGWYRGPILVHG
ncbi:hypothetical protein RchiOBHm_Chr4g0443361 [Rosa chinensis]|uniref:Secreted protein n=1 Tax=Rosa chinensis TaxID=74649 RepID=A0A2P6R3V3_ROSCH|nr:hypothetical protein RchiOBHm_Chr4g0443361 [Rosa chinensis]